MTTEHQQLVEMYYYIGAPSNKLHKVKTWGSKRVFILINLEDEIQPIYNTDELKFPIFPTRYQGQKFLDELTIQITRARIESQPKEPQLTIEKLEDLYK